MRLFKLCLGLVFLVVLLKYDVEAEIIEIADQGDFKNEIQKDALVVVDFWATWCGPCVRIAPFFKELSENKENADVVFLKVDVDEAEDLSAACGITAMPTFQFYKSGNKVDEIVGADQGKLQDFLNKYK